MSTLPTTSAGLDALRHDPLVDSGRRVLLSGQAPSGALVASPNFPVYDFAWLRDGSFCAQALDVLGEHDAAAAFHAWVARTLLEHSDRAESAVASVRRGGTQAKYLPARYTLDGQLEPDPEEWPNFQLDGYGTWLHAAAEHIGPVAPGVDMTRAVRLVSDYLRATWGVPCYDCWEEFGDGAHTSTLLSVVSGLRAAARMLEDAAVDADADLVAETLRTAHVRDGRLTKSATDDRVDASLLWHGTTFNLELPDADAVRDATVAAVAADLWLPEGGVRRYVGDSYYGGGEWLLLTSWLGWQGVRTGDADMAHRCDGWVRSQAGPDGFLAEQAVERPQFADMVEEWTEKWGPVASPLLWSHAMQVIHSAAMVEAGWRTGA